MDADGSSSRVVVCCSSLFAGNVRNISITLLSLNLHFLSALRKRKEKKSVVGHEYSSSIFDMKDGKK